MKPEHYLDGLTNPGGSGSNLTGFSEVSITHPGQYTAGATGPPAVVGNATLTFYEANPFPRALYDTSI